MSGHEWIKRWQVYSMGLFSQSGFGFRAGLSARQLRAGLTAIKKVKPLRQFPVRFITKQIAFLANLSL